MLKIHIFLCMQHCVQKCCGDGDQETSTSMLQVAAMQGMILVQQKNALNWQSNWLLTFLSTMEIPPAKRNSCYVHFCYFWLPYTANKSTTCALTSTGILLQAFCFRKGMSTAEKAYQTILHPFLVPWSFTLWWQPEAQVEVSCMLSITFQNTALTVQSVLMVDESQSLT